MWDERSVVGFRRIWARHPCFADVVTVCVFKLILESRESGDDESGEITKTLASPSHPMSSLVPEVASTASSQPALTVPNDAGLVTIIPLFLFLSSPSFFPISFPIPLFALSYFHVQVRFCVCLECEDIPALNDN